MVMPGDLLAKGHQFESLHTKRPTWRIFYINVKCGLVAVWPDWAIFCTLGNHSKLVATIILSKSPTLLGNFCKGLVKFLVNSYLGNFYRHWAIFIWSHCLVASLALGHRKPKWDFETFLHHGLAKTPIPLKLILSFVSFVKHFRLLRHFKHFWNVDQKCVKWRSKIIHSKALLRHCSRGASWL